MNTVSFFPSPRLVSFLEALRETVHRTEGYVVLDPNPKNTWVLAQMEFEGSLFPVIFRPDLKFRLATFMPGGVLEMITWGQMIVLETGTPTNNVVGTVAPDVYPQKVGDKVVWMVGIPKEEKRLARIATWGYPAYDPFRMSIDNDVPLPESVIPAGIIHSNDAVIGGWNPKGASPQEMMISGADIRAGVNIVDAKNPAYDWVPIKRLLAGNLTKDAMSIAALELSREAGIIDF